MIDLLKDYKAYFNINTVFLGNNSTYRSINIHLKEMLEDYDFIAYSIYCNSMKDRMLNSDSFLDSIDNVIDYIIERNV